MATPTRGRLADRWARLDHDLREQALARPRESIGVPAVDRRDAWSELDPVTVRALLAAADADRRTAWPHPRLSDYARYWRDGVRTAYEDPAGELRRRTSTAVLAAAITGERERLDEAADGLLFLCEQSTWCWAAHESFATERGQVVPDPERPYLDLGAAETVEILAWADLVLAPALDERVPGLRERLRLETRRRVVEPFLTERTWHWLGGDGRQHNWNPWISGHVLAAGLFLTDDVQVRSQVVDLVIEGLDNYLAAQPADGGCDEGFLYWWNGPARLAEALRLLDVITGGRFAPWDCEPLPELARYPQRMALGHGWYVNVGDGPARPADDRPWHVPHRWGRVLGDDRVIADAASHRDPTRPAVHPVAGLGRCLAGLHDPDWIAAAPAVAPLPATSWLPDVQLLVSRERAGTADGLTVAVKGGHNDENHNHNDVGSYLIALDGTPTLIDLGQPTYTAISFTERRYEQWVTQSQWHNLPVVNGVGQSPGAVFRASAVEASSAPEEDVFRLGLERAYPAEAGCRSWLRVVRLDRRACAVTVTDRWSVASPAEVRLHHVVAGEPLTHEAGSLVIRTLAGALLVLRWDPAHGPGHVERHLVDDPLLAGVWGEAVHRLVIAPTSGAASADLLTGTFTLTVERAPEDTHGDR